MKPIVRSFANARRGVKPAANASADPTGPATNWRRSAPCRAEVRQWEERGADMGNSCRKGAGQELQTSGQKRSPSAPVYTCRNPRHCAENCCICEQLLTRQMQSCLALSSFVTLVHA